MAQILVRDMDEAVVERLKKRAKADGRSLQAEVKLILEKAANEPKMDMKETLASIMKLRERFKGRKFPDTVELIREDRDR